MAPSASIILSLLPLTLKAISSSSIITPKNPPETRQSPLLLATISEREQEAVLYPGSLTLMVLPLIEVAKTQCPPLWTFKITTFPAAKLEAILLLATLPTQLSPSELTDPQTKRSPLTQPPCPLSHVFKVLGLQFFPIPERAIATELIKHPALQIVLAEVPSCQPAHRLSHCLYKGQLLAAAKAKSRAIAKNLKFIVEIINQYNCIIIFKIRTQNDDLLRSFIQSENYSFRINLQRT